MVINGATGSVGIANSYPLSMLHLGNCTVLNSAPVIVFGKNVNNTSSRNAFMGSVIRFSLLLEIMETLIAQIH